MELRSQTEIVSAWNDNATVLVSIVCATYNHEQYLTDAINGFLSQKTTFAIEIIIHDDASRDGTPEIIKAYALKYPKLIVPILQSENQYSKGSFKPTVHAAKFARGKYIAFCEGDDYWVNENKLQLQVESLEKHPDVDFSFHAAHIASEGIISNSVGWRLGKTRVIPFPDLLETAAGSFAPTASYVIRKRVLEELPVWFLSKAPVGDYFIERYAAIRGGALYLEEPMSVYREFTPESWSLKVVKDNAVFRKSMKGMFTSMDLMAADFVKFSSAFERSYARLYLKYAIDELLMDEHNNYKGLILKSVQKWKYISARQFALYKLRHLPGVAKVILKISRWISAKTAV